MLSYSGVVALSLLILVLLSSLRLTLFESLKFSLTSMFRSHHLIAWIFFVLATIHFFAASAVWHTAKVPLFDSLLLLLRDLPSLSGLVAYLFFCTVICAAHVDRLKRREWIFVHRLSLVGVISVLIHVIYVWRFRLIEFDVMTIIRWLNLLAMICIVVTFTLHLLRPDLLNSSRHFTVVSVSEIRHDLLDLTIALETGSKQWLSGQFGYFSFRCRGTCGVSRRWHPFTILECPSPQALRIVIKSIGFDTHALQNIEIGTQGYVIGPYSGINRLAACKMPQLWLAGGLGILPFLGLANHLAREKLTNLDIHLVYLHRPETQPLFIEELSHLVKRFPKFNLQVLSIPKENEQEINSISSLVPDIAQRAVAIAGPHAMVVFWKKSLQRIGVKNILVEDYSR